MESQPLDSFQRIEDLVYQWQLQQWEAAKGNNKVANAVKSFTATAGDANMNVKYCNPASTISDRICKPCQRVLTSKGFRKVLLHQSFRALGRSSDSCHLCLLMFDALCLEIDRSGRTFTCLHDNKNVSVWAMLKIRPTHLWDDTDVEGLCLTAIEVTIQDGIRTPPALDKDEMMKAIKYPAVDIPVIALPEELADILEEVEELEDKQTGSRTRIRLSQYWLRLCRREHRDCCMFQGERPILPSRVLDVGPPDGSQHPFLYESRGQVGDYVSLSHRWGGSTMLTTTMRDINQRKSEITLKSMPKTFQDAVFVTRALGIGYLWIDSLCIVQDNLGDWEKEAELMGQVYKNATLTIAAVAANSGDSGCFLQYDGRRNRPCRIGTFQFDLGSEQLPNSMRNFRCYALQKGQQLTGYEDSFRPRGPLDSRGWVMQEEVLSTRLLSFCHNGIYWECLHMDAAEFVPEGYIPGYGSERWSPAQRYARAFKRGLLNKICVGFERFGDVPLHDSWEALIENYSSRLLTHESDRLAAVYGLARSMQDAANIPYVAGLWEDHLHQQLMWHVERRVVEIDKRIFGDPDSAMSMWSPKNVILAPRPQGPYQRAVVAPSWSWATVNRRVKWERIDRLDMQPLLEIVKKDMRNKGISETEGRLTVRGWMRTAYAKYGSNTEFDKIVDPTDDSNGPATYYSDRGTWQDGRVMCLALARSSSATYSLVLYPTERCSLISTGNDKVMEFRRIGLAQWSNADWSRFMGDDQNNDLSTNVKEISRSRKGVEIVLDIV